MLYSILFNNQLSATDAVIMFIISIFVFFISLAMHEFAHGFVAYKMGDPTPKVAGRITLNPFKHLDLSGFLFFIFFGFGWAKPMPVNPLNFKKYKKGIRLVSIAGVLTNFLIGLLSAGIYAILIATVGLPNEIILYVYMLLSSFMIVNSALTLFNLLPIFPLDGFNFISSFMKTENKFIKYNYRNGSKLLLGIVLVTIVIDLLFGIDILSIYLSLINDFIYSPIVMLGVL